MPDLSEVHNELANYCTQQSIWFSVSGVYDLFPELQPSIVKPEHLWPNKWPNGGDHGLYMFFDSQMQLGYIGKSSGKSSCIRSRLNGYFDSAARRQQKLCVLRDTWNGYYRPWGTSPRFVVTVALRTDRQTGCCPEAEMLEMHLIRRFHPPENTAGRIKH